MQRHATIFIKTFVIYFGRCNERNSRKLMRIKIDYVRYEGPYYMSNLNQYVFGNAIVHADRNINKRVPNVPLGDIARRCLKAFSCHYRRSIEQHAPCPTCSFMDRMDVVCVAFFQMLDVAGNYDHLPCKCGFGCHLRHPAC